jgi:hypothetical protein
MGTVGPRRLWMSEVRDLVAGAPDFHRRSVGAAQANATAAVPLNRHAPRMRGMESRLKCND